jgi:hypothetical protein
MNSQIELVDEDEQQRVVFKYALAGDRHMRLKGRRDARSRRRAGHWLRQFNRWGAKVDPLSNHLY